MRQCPENKDTFEEWCKKKDIKLATPAVNPKDFTPAGKLISGKEYIAAHEGEAPFDQLKYQYYRLKMVHKQLAPKENAWMIKNAERFKGVKPTGEVIKATPVSEIVKEKAAPTLTDLYAVGPKNDTVAMMRHDKISSVKELGGGANKSYVVTNGFKGVFKPAEGNFEYKVMRDNGFSAATSHLKEAASYQMSTLLGMDSVPPTVIREVKGKLGSVQMFKPGSLVKDKGEIYKIAKGKEREAVFDYICGQNDRHYGNMLLAGDKVSLIDNGMSFPKPLFNGVKCRSMFVEANQGMELSEGMRAKLMSLQLQRSEITKELSTLLKSDEINGMFNRIDDLLRLKHIPSHGEQLPVSKGLMSLHRDMREVMKGGRIVDISKKEIKDVLREYPNRATAHKAFQQWFETSEGAHEIRIGEQVLSGSRKRGGSPEFAKAMNDILDKTKPYEGTIWRGGTAEEYKEMLKVKPGEIWEQQLTVSCSKSKDVADEFLFGAFDQNFEDLFVLKVKPKTAVDISPLAPSEYRYQKEVVMRKDSKYKVVSNTKKIGDCDYPYNLIELEEI